MPLKYNLIVKILKALNFTCIRSKGSHFRYEITIGFHNEYPPKTAKSMLRDIAKIEGIEYRDLILKYNIKL